MKVHCHGLNVSCMSIRLVCHASYGPMCHPTAGDAKKEEGSSDVFVAGAALGSAWCMVWCDFSFAGQVSLAEEAMEDDSTAGQVSLEEEAMEDDSTAGQVSLEEEAMEDDSTAGQVSLEEEAMDDLFDLPWTYAVK